MGHLSKSNIMKLLAISASIFAISNAFLIEKQEANTLLRVKRWGKSNEEKTNEKVNKRCGYKSNCSFEEWAETAENYEAKGYSSEEVRSALKREWFTKVYEKCTKDITGKSPAERKQRRECIDQANDLKDSLKQGDYWPNTTTTPTVTTEVTTKKPTTTSEATTSEATTANRAATEPTTTADATTAKATTTVKATTTPEPTTTTEKTTTEKVNTDHTLTSAWATTRAKRRNNRRRG